MSDQTWDDRTSTIRLRLDQLEADARASRGRVESLEHISVRIVERVEFIGRFVWVLLVAVVGSGVATLFAK